MTPIRPCFLLGTLLALATATAAAQTTTQDASPAPIGQVSKDSVWVPTPDRLIHRMLQLADTTRRDFVIDLGSGDGRIPIAAAKAFGARALGVELEQNLIDYSIRAAKRQGVAGRARFLKQDLFETDLSRATVITMYISPPVMVKLRAKLLTLAAGTRIVSHHFTLGDWEPDEMVQVEERRAYLWLVPARVEGRWTMRLGDTHYVLRFEQAHQMLKSAADIEGRPTTAFGARLRGDILGFNLIDRNGDSRLFTGKVQGNAMQGESNVLGGQLPASWSAKLLP